MTKKTTKTVPYAEPQSPLGLERMRVARATNKRRSAIDRRGGMASPEQVSDDELVRCVMTALACAVGMADHDEAMKCVAEALALLQERESLFIPKRSVAERLYEVVCPDGVSRHLPYHRHGDAVFDAKFYTREPGRCVHWGAVGEPCHGGEHSVREAVTQ